METLTDTHCHLDFSTFDPDREAVLERASQNGIRYILNPGVDLATSKEAVGLAEKYAKHVFAAVGIHPNDGHSWNNDSLHELRELASHPGVIAIGEIGLDYYRDRLTPEIQKDIFQQQLNLASDLNLPVIIHNRSANADILTIAENWTKELKKINSPLMTRPGVFHAFNDNLDVAHQIIAMDFYLGIGGAVTFKNASFLQNVISQLPLDRVLLETDAPFLTPQPHRGKRNEPAYIACIAEKVAGLQHKTMTEIALMTSHNSEILFSWGASLGNSIL